MCGRQENVRMGTYSPVEVISAKAFMKYNILNLNSALSRIGSKMR